MKKVVEVIYRKDVEKFYGVGVGGMFDSVYSDFLFEFGVDGRGRACCSDDNLDDDRKIYVGYLLNNVMVDVLVDVFKFIGGV